MQVCFITNLYEPFVLGGAENNVKKTAEGLMEKGHKVSVITTSPSRKSYSEVINGIKIYRIYPLNIYPMYASSQYPIMIKPIYYLIDLWNPYSYKKIRNILKNEKIDVVHINNFRGLSLSSFSAVKSLKLPLVFTAHDYSLICIMGTLLKASHSICTKPSFFCKMYTKVQKKIVSNKPDLVLSPSQFVIDKLKEASLFENTETKKFSLGIELYEKKKSKSYETIDLLYVGTLSKHKGAQILIQAFKELHFENIKLHIVGKGKEFTDFQKLADFDKRIIFHGFVSDDELRKLYQEANITVVPSIWYDNSPMVIYESFKNGTPVIGSRIGGIPELIKEGYNGYLFEPGDSNELKNLLTNLFQNPSILKNLETGSLECSKEYNLCNYICSLECFYSKLLKKD